MDVKSFIASGILEAYALGQCTPEERAQVEQMLQAHPEVRAELEAIEQALEQIAHAHAVPPPPHLKEALLERARAEAGPSTPSAVRRLGRWQSALPWAAVLLLGGALLWQVNERSRLSEQLQLLEQQVADCEKRNQQSARLQEVVALLRDPNTQAIVLSNASEEAAGKVAATVWHNSVRAETVLDINSLPAPPPGRYFQFWAIVQGKPVSMGMVQLNGEDAFQRLPFLPEAQAFAISVEDKPQGNAIPTQVLMVGKI